MRTITPIDALWWGRTGRRGVRLTGIVALFYHRPTVCPDGPFCAWRWIFFGSWRGATPPSRVDVDGTVGDDCLFSTVRCRPIIFFLLLRFPPLTTARLDSALPRCELTATRQLIRREAFVPVSQVSVSAVRCVHGVEPLLGRRGGIRAPSSPPSVGLPTEPRGFSKDSVDSGSEPRATPCRTRRRERCGCFSMHAARDLLACMWFCSASRQVLLQLRHFRQRRPR